MNFTYMLTSTVILVFVLVHFLVRDELNKKCDKKIPTHDLGRFCVPGVTQLLDLSRQLKKVNDLCNPVIISK